MGRRTGKYMLCPSAFHRQTLLVRSSQAQSLLSCTPTGRALHDNNGVQPLQPWADRSLYTQGRIIDNYMGSMYSSFTSCAGTWALVAGQPQSWVNVRISPGRLPHSCPLHWAGRARGVLSRRRDLTRSPHPFSDESPRKRGRRLPSICGRVMALARECRPSPRR